MLLGIATRTGQARGRRTIVANLVAGNRGDSLGARRMAAAVSVSAALRIARRFGVIYTHLVEGLRRTRRRQAPALSATNI